MEERGFIRDMLDVKVLILFVAAKAKYPLTLQKIYELCYQDDRLSYFDVSIAVPQMVESGHLEQLPDGTYVVTQKGAEQEEVTRDSIAFPVMQRALAASSNVIMDGRDIGTVVLPDADVKIFLYADVKVRAGRRALELEQRGTPKPYEEVLREMEERDYNDTHRAAAPLRAADDAIMIDTSDMDFDASRELLLDVIRGSVSN